MNTLLKRFVKGAGEIISLSTVWMIVSCNSGNQNSDSSTKPVSGSTVKDSSAAVTNGIKSNSQANLKQAKANEDFKLTVYREYPDKKCTSGYLAVNDEIVCYTVEKPWKDNRENVSSIPAGTYDAKLRYDHIDHWRIELLDVPGRTNVQIHVGNNTDDTKGCIIVGERLENNLCAIKGGTSVPAYKKLKGAFYGTDNPTSTPDKNISVEIKDAGQQ